MRVTTSSRWIASLGLSANNYAELQRRWSRHVLDGLDRVVVAVDWTDLEDDKQSVVSIQAIGEKGRATSLVWETVDMRRLRSNRNRLESLVIQRLHEALPEDVEVIRIADRGFGDVERYAELDLLGWHYVGRFRGVVRMSAGGGEL